jgi:hypothetical protein
VLSHASHHLFRQVVSARPLSSVFSVVRPWGEPRAFQVSKLCFFLNSVFAHTRMQHHSHHSPHMPSFAVSLFKKTKYKLKHLSRRALSRKCVGATQA